MLIDCLQGQFERMNKKRPETNRDCSKILGHRFKCYNQSPSYKETREQKTLTDPQQPVAPLVQGIWCSLLVPIGTHKCAHKYTYVHVNIHMYTHIFKKLLKRTALSQLYLAMICHYRLTLMEHNGRLWLSLGQGTWGNVGFSTQCLYELKIAIKNFLRRNKGER